MYSKINKFTLLILLLFHTIRVQAVQIFDLNANSNALVLMGIKGLDNFSDLCKQLDKAKDRYNSSSTNKFKICKKPKKIIFSVCMRENIDHLLPQSALVDKDPYSPIFKNKNIEWYVVPVQPYLYSIERRGASVETALNEFKTEHTGFDALIDLIHKKYTEEKSSLIIVHCIHGASRSVGTIAAYFIKYKKYNPKTAIRIVSGQCSDDYCKRYKHTFNYLCAYNYYLKSLIKK